MSANTEGGHPLAGRLIQLLRERDSDGPVIEVGAGRGRNTRALEEAGIRVTALPDEVLYTQLPARRGAFAAALSTHAYLHGTADKLRLGFAELARVLAPGSPVLFTLGSISDSRYGLGIPYDDVTFAPGDGPEAGVPHAYLDRQGVIDVTRPFEIVSVDEVEVDDVVGRWAHEGNEVGGRVHWFVEARRRS